MGETEAQRNDLTHRSYKATKSQSHLFIQQLFSTGLLCALPSGDPALQENVSVVLGVLPGGGRAGSGAGCSEAACLPQWRPVPTRGLHGMTWGYPPRQRISL